MSASEYSRLDRALHRLAFGGAGIEVQKSLADLEDRLYGGQLVRVALERPIFVTSLPRAGTTVLLERLANLPGVVSHTYRHMPFVLTPLLWQKVSGPFRKKGALRERVHGDGVRVGYDSAEAFEEVLWRAHFPAKYHDNRIELWDADETDDEGTFEDFFKNHVRKLLLLEAGPRRYVSKNNANIARIAKLRVMFGDAVVLVPFREPVAHVASLRKTHERLLAVQQADPFASRYMRDIGHFDFGEHLRPIDFGGWVGEDRQMDGSDVNHWLYYWIAAFTHLLQQDVAFVDYDALCADPQAGLTAVASALRLEHPELLVNQHEALRPATVHDTDAAGCDAELLDAARALHTQLRAVAIHQRM